MADRQVFPPVWAYSNLLANATTTIKTGSGVLHGITINDVGAGGNTLTVYDNTAGSGTVIATIDTVELNGRYLPFDVRFGTGLTVVMATGTAANITVAYV